MVIRTCIVTAVIVMACSVTATALPQFSLLTGNRCSNCHLTPSGGGLRNELGAYAWSDVGIVKRDYDAVKWLYDLDGGNSLLDNKLLVGVDLRAQTTRSFFDTAAPRVWFPMQATVYGAYKAGSALTVEGAFNLASLRQAPNSTQRIRYAGQRMGLLSALVTPDSAWPTIRVGMIRPTYGIRYDDHTMFPYSYVTAGSRLTYVGPDFGEYGAELSYEHLDWLTLTAGVFGSSALAQVRLSDGLAAHSAVQGNAPTIAARAVLWPRFLDDAINTYIGASVLNNGSFTMVNTFLGVGLTDNLSLMADYTTTRMTDVLTSDNAMLELSWNPWSPLIPYVRWEHGTTWQAHLVSVTATSVVFGAQVFVMPFVELRPEYRLWDTAQPGVTARWNLQLHLFY